MAADPGIFQSLLQPVRSVADYSSDMDAQDLKRQQLVGATRQNALAALVAQQTQSEMSDKAEKRNRLQRLYSGLPASADPLARARAMQADPMLAADGVAAEKAIRDAERVQGQTAKDAADAAKTGGETADASLKRYRGALDFIDTPQGAARWLQAQYQDPALSSHMQALGTFEQAVQRIPQTPQEFQQWRQQAGMGMENFQKLLLDREKAAEVKRNNIATDATSRSNNRATVGASMANAAAVRDAAKTAGDATRAAANTQRDQAAEMKLADDYRAQSKEFGQAQSAHKQLTATLGSATTSPAATLAAATKFMKILDPGSVVRESELGMALAASGVLDRATNYISTLQSGQKLTATQAKDFKDISDKMYVAAQQVQQTIDADYKAKAKAYGLRPEMVTQDLGQNAKTVNWGDLK